MKAAFVTFGCRLNKAEALEMEAEYAAAGWDVVSAKTGANGTAPPDVIVVRGCSVTAKAQRDCEKEIAHLRARFPQAEIRIAGCLPGAAASEPPRSAAVARSSRRGRSTWLR